MTKPVCKSCGAEVDGAFLCAGCVDDTIAKLAKVDSRVQDLLITLCRWARITTNNTGVKARDAETPLAFNWAAGEALWQLHHAIDQWAGTINRGPVVLPRDKHLTDPKDPARITPPRGRTAALAGWLIEHTPAAMNHPDIADFLGEFDQAMNRAARTIDRQPDRAYAGPCYADTETGECQEDLYTAPKAVRATCKRCGTTHDMEQRREWLLKAAEDQLVTAVEASMALPGLIDRPVTAAMIRGYAWRGKLAQHPPDPRVGKDVKGREQWLYRLGEILDVVLGADEDVKKPQQKKEPAK